MKTVVGVKADGSSNLPPSATQKVVKGLKVMVLLVWVTLTCLLLGRGIPLIPMVIWYEVHYGKTNIPELICLFHFIGYILWRIMWWRFLSNPNVCIQEKERM